MEGTRTRQNLMMAYLGESDARNRYTWYAKVAKKEGYEQIGAIFLETAEQELSHAKNLHKLIGEQGTVPLTAGAAYTPIGTTAENLRTAVMGEGGEAADLYPTFAAVAEAEGFPKIAAFFKAVGKAEAAHEKRFRRLLENIEAGRVFSREEPVLWQCRKCGYVAEGRKAPETCPACFHPQGYFEVLADNY